MRRLFSVAAAVATVLAVFAAPASADQALKLGPGPPLFSGDFEGSGTLVFHCNPFDPEGPGAVAFTTNAGNHGNCPKAEL